MNIIRKFLSGNNFSRPGVLLNTVRGVVIHWVGNAGTSALFNRNYFDSLKNQKDKGAGIYASAHFIIGLEGEIIQCIPLTEIAYHAGAKKYSVTAQQKLGSYPNNCTVGIELCHLSADGKFTALTWESAVKLAALLCRLHGLEPYEALFRHYDVTGKVCPKWFVEHAEEWERFKRAVSENKEF